MPVPVIKELMSHSSIATTMRYVTVTGGQLDAAIRQAFGQQVGNKSAETNNAESGFET
jgi:site-specific recombinase XerD